MSVNIKLDVLKSVIDSALDSKLKSAIDSALDAKFKLLQPTFTTIFNKLDRIEVRLTNVETRLTNVENDIAIMKKDIKNLKDYNKNESAIREQKDSHALKQYLSDMNHSATINMVKFGNFYIPFNNEPLTDIDGCVIFKTIPVPSINRNGKKIFLDNSCVYLIESKHGITNAILNKKLKQFITILDLISKVQNNKYIKKSKTYNFDTMIETYNIKEWPTHIKFLLASDKMTPTVIKLVTAITTDTLTDELYNALLFDNIKTHPIMQEIQNSEIVHDYVKKQLNICNSLIELEAIIYPAEPVKNTPSQLDFYDKRKTILPFTPHIESLLVPIDEYKTMTNVLKGKIGFINNDDIQLPESVISNGFNSKNRLLNMAANSSIMNSSKPVNLI